MNEQRAFLWPRLIVGIRSESGLKTDLQPLFAAYGVDCIYEDGHVLLLDISHWQVRTNTAGSAESAIAQLQHLLNLHLSPLHYSLGIGSDAVWAFHAASGVGPGQEKWVLPWQVEKELALMPVSVLQVLDKRMPQFFQSCGKHKCDELVEFGKEFLARRFGSAGEMLWYLLRGRFRQYPDLHELPNGNMRWRISLPVRTRSVRSLSAHLWRLYVAVNRNLERMHRQAEQLDLKYQGSEETCFHQPALRLQVPLRNRRELNRHLEKMHIDKNGIAQFQITASHLSHPAGQLDLF